MRRTWYSDERLPLEKRSIRSRQPVSINSSNMLDIFVLHLPCRAERLRIDTLNVLLCWLNQTNKPNDSSEIGFVTADNTPAFFE